MFAEHVENPGFFDLAHKMQVVDDQGDLYMDPGQWAAVCEWGSGLGDARANASSTAMYLGFAFEKMPISWNPTRDLLDTAIVDSGMDMPEQE